MHLVEPLGFSLDDREVRRAGLDYWPRVNARVWPDWHAFQAELPALGEPFFFTPEAPRDLWTVSFPPKLVLLFGRESKGFSDEIRSAYRDRLLAIPMIDRSLRSLNLSTCVGIAVYEALRQRRARS